MSNRDMCDRDTIVQLYFRLGLPYSEITAMLAVNHDVIMSNRTLHRILRRSFCYRRGHQSDLLQVIDFIHHMLQQSGSLHGYRWMHGRCVQHGFAVSREVVRVIMLELDTEGVRLRAGRRLRRREYFAKGPNFVWHIDGYDKLKPYGLCIHGCIDGYSRRVIWLKVHSTNNNPRIVAGYFIDAVAEILSVPKFVRGDRGTENGHIAAMQTFLAGSDTFLYGRSVANQRIEAWWGILRKECGQFWMDVLEHLKDQGHFTGSFVDRALVQFCFSRVLQVNAEVCLNCSFIRSMLYTFYNTGTVLVHANVRSMCLHAVAYHQLQQPL